MIRFITLLFHFCCHQQADRTPVLEGDLFPVCYRCAGIFFGIFSSYGLLLLRRFAAMPITKKELPLVILFLLPLAVDGCANAISLWQTPGWLRSITGLLLGVLLPFFLNFITHSNEPVPAAQQMQRKTTSGILLATVLGLLLLLLLNFSHSFTLFTILACICACALLFFVLHFAVANPWFRIVWFRPHRA